MKLKLMTDYHCFPLWETSPDFGEVDPRSLPLSEALIERLDAWKAVYDSILNIDDPAKTGFESDEAEVAFEKQGVDLWLELRSELGSAYTVSYFSTLQGRVIDDPGALAEAIGRV